MNLEELDQSLKTKISQKKCIETEMCEGGLKDSKSENTMKNLRKNIMEDTSEQPMTASCA